MLRVKLLKPGDLIQLDSKGHKFRFRILIDQKDKSEFYTLVRIDSKYSPANTDYDIDNNSIFTVLNDRKETSYKSLSRGRKKRLYFEKHACLIDNKIIYISSSFLASYFNKLKGK